MNARGKLNVFWVVAALVIAIAVVGSLSSGLLVLLIAGAVVAWACGNKNIR